MESMNEVLKGKYGKSTYKLEADYRNQYDNDMLFRKIANDLELPTDTLMKYTTKIEKTTCELKNCKKILIEVNQTCNLNCTYCFYRDYGRTTKSLSIDNINELLEKCPIAEEFYLTGGECFTSPIIEEIISKLSQRGKVITFTNGVMLNKYDENRLVNVVNNVDRFIISFDSFDFKNYFCRKKLDQTINTIKKIFIHKETAKVEKNSFLLLLLSLATNLIKAVGIPN